MGQNARHLQRFGAMIVCELCGVPQAESSFARDSTICRQCKHKRRDTMSVPKRLSRPDPDDMLQQKLSTKLQKALKDADPQIVNGVTKAIDRMKRTPQEVFADIISQTMYPEDGDGSPLSKAQREAMPRNYSIPLRAATALQTAQIVLDQQMEGINPFENLDPDELRSIVLQGTIDHVKSDAELRKDLIRAFLMRCDTFLDEVMEVAGEMQPASDDSLVFEESA